MVESNKIWESRVNEANKRFETWSNKYDCSNLEQYYRGFQWKYQASTNQPKPYTLNLVYSTIKIKMANYLFSRPKANIVPKPQFQDWDLETASASAQLKEDVLNTIVSDQRSNFQENVELAALDSFFRFGIIEVGYAADWVENPRAGKPLRKSDRKQDISVEDDKVVVEPAELPENERIYFKRILSDRFRVGFSDSAIALEMCDWCGYYDYVSQRDIKTLPGIKNDEVYSSYEYTPGNTEQSEIKPSDISVKVWHIWDNRAKIRYLFNENFVELKSQPFSRLALFDLRWDLELNQWFPIPPVFQWVSPQDEINEAREQSRNHRRRFTRKYWAQKDRLDAEELDKFQWGPDGSIILANGGADDPIKPIAAPDLGAASSQALIVPKDDFNIVSGTSSEMRGEADRTTATQARIIATHSQVRESSEQAKISKWLSKIMREALLLCQENFSQDIWVKLSVDNRESLLSEVNIYPYWNMINPLVLSDGYDFQVDVEPSSLSPMRNDEEKRKFLEFIALMAQFPQLSLSPVLIREAAYRVGYRNERVIKEMQSAALLQVMGMQAQAQGMDQEGNRAGQMITAQETPNDTEQIRNQLDGQLLQ